MEATILALLSKNITPLMSNNMAGKIIAGKIADGTYDKITFFFSVYISFFNKPIILNLVRKVIMPAIIINDQLIFFSFPVNLSV